MRVLVLIVALMVLLGGCITGDGDEPSGDEIVSTTTSTIQGVVETTLPEPVESGKTTTTTTTTTTRDYVKLLERTTTTAALPPTGEGCLKLGNVTERDNCLYDMAGREGKQGLCDDISVKNLMFKCKAHVEERPEFCNGIDVPRDRDYCFWMMAFRWSKIGYCKTVSDQRVKDMCVFNFLRDKKPDPLECFEIRNASLRDGCIYYHIGLGLINPNLCGLITGWELELECNKTYLGK
jgi:hypothetical protein